MARPMRGLGIDLGTGSVKVALVDAEGRTLARARRPCPGDTPSPDRAEADPESWWRAVVEAVRATVAEAPGLPDAVAVAGQMHGVVLAAADGAAVRPAIGWPDRRAVAEAEAYRRAPLSLTEPLGNPLAPGMAGPILAWLRAHEPGALETAEAALSPKDWLRLRLTGTVVTEPSDASATLLWDLPGDRWHLPLARHLGLDPALLPRVIDSQAVAGALRADAARILGLPAGLPVIAGAADVAAALVGAGAREAEAHLSVGSGAQVVAPIAAPSVDASGGTHCYRRAGPGWYAMGAVQNAGLALDWVRGLLGVDWDTAHAALDATAPGAEGLTFLPFLTGERTPWLQPALRGSWEGIADRHGRAHLLRAALEGVAFAIRDARDAVAAHTVLAGRTRLVGGGGGDGRAWQQLLADVLETPIEVTAEPDVTARGAALLAILGAGGAAQRAPTEWRPQADRVVEPSQAAGAYRAARDRYLGRAGCAAEEAAGRRGVGGPRGSPGVSVRSARRGSPRSPGR